MVSARRSDRSWLNASPPTPSVWPATTKVEPRSFGSDSAAPSACPEGIDSLLMSAELKSKWISRSIFGLVAAIWAISSRSPIDIDRVLRLRRLCTKFISCALAGSTWGVPTERPRVSGFGCSALRIWSDDTLSPAKARPAVVDGAAQMVIAFSPENLTKLVIVVVLAVARLFGRLDAANLGWVHAIECDVHHMVNTAGRTCIFPAGSWRIAKGA